MAEKVLIYAGTTEGRLLAQELSRAHIACDVHVATEYGQMVMPELAGVKVCVGRLDVEEMRALLKKNGQNNYAAVVDATHPFATKIFGAKPASKKIKFITKNRRHQRNGHRIM